MARKSFPETYAYPVDLMLTGRATETTYLDTYLNIPAAAAHSRSTTSRGDPQQDHDHRRLRADHETIKQNAPAGRSRGSTRSRRASRFLRALFGRWRRGVMRVAASSLDVARGVSSHCASGVRARAQAKNELIGHSRAGAFKPRLRVESNGCDTGPFVQNWATTCEQLVELCVC